MRLLAVPGAVIEAAEQPDLLRSEPDDADGAQGPSGIHDALGRGGRDRHARCVVDGARPEIPAVEMPADEDGCSLGIASGHFGDDIARAALSDLRDEGQVHGHGLAALEDPLELFRVGDGERAGGDGLHAVRELLHAGVRVAVMIGADRADHNGERALAACH